MSNTIGTIIRIVWLMAWLITGWFMGATALYALATLALGLPFSWSYAWVAFSMVIAIRIFYPRNVFTR